MVKEKCFACLLEGKDNYAIRSKAGENAVPLCDYHTLAVLNGDLSVAELDEKYREKRRY